MKIEFEVTPESHTEFMIQGLKDMLDTIFYFKYEISYDDKKTAKAIFTLLDYCCTKEEAIEIRNKYKDRM